MQTKETVAEKMNVCRDATAAFQLLRTYEKKKKPLSVRSTHCYLCHHGEVVETDEPMMHLHWNEPVSPKIHRMKTWSTV